MHAHGQAQAQPATARNYEIWYACASGSHPALNQQVNAALKANGTISEADLAQIYESHLSPTRLTERIEEVGSQVKGEIDQVMAMIDAAAGSTSSYNDDTAQSLIERADACLYAAKRHGRNRVMSETDPEIAAGDAAARVA